MCHNVTKELQRTTITSSQWQQKQVFRFRKGRHEPPPLPTTTTTTKKKKKYLLNTTTVLRSR